MSTFRNFYCKAIQISALAVFVASPLAVRATGTFTLTNGNSSTTIWAASPYSMTDWTVDAVEQLYRQGFWYRAGNDWRENNISTIFSSAVQNSPNTLNTVYLTGGFKIEISYSLLGGSDGSGGAAIGENIKVTNLTGNSLDFHFFQYVDFDLGGSHLGDTVWLEQNLQGYFDKAYQKKGNAFFGDEIVSPAASHGEVGLSQSILTKLDDSFATTLNDSVGPVTGDAVWGFQWDFVLAGHESFSIDINKSVYVTPIPEPTALGLLSLGMIMLGVGRRNLPK